MKKFAKNKIVQYGLWGMVVLVLFKVYQIFFGSKKDVSDKLADSQNEVLVDYINSLQDLNLDNSELTLTPLEAKAKADVIWNELAYARWLGSWTFSQSNIMDAFFGLSTEDKKLVLQNAGVKELPPLFGIGDGDLVTIYGYADAVLSYDDKQFLMDLFNDTGIYGV